MKCPSCGALPPKNPEQRFWWDVWPCLFCDKHVCNEPVFTGKTRADGLRESMTCYVRHLAEKHPDVY